jgi:hypothetical protein
MPQKGSMYFVNNFIVFHSRVAFRDDATKDAIHPRGRSRHLLRLWLRHPVLGRTIHEPLNRRWEQVFDNDNAKNGRWLLTRNMEPQVVSDRLFQGSFPATTFNSCQNG